jgi:AraC-like DNA-binding protein
MQPLMERARLLHSRDLDETRGFYAAKDTAFEPGRPVKGAASSLVRVNGFYLSDVWFGYVEYAGAVSLRLSPQSSSFRGYDRKLGVGPSARAAHGDYYLHVPLQGQMEAEIGGRVVACNRARGVVISPGMEQVMRAQPGAARLTLSVRGDALLRALAALLGDLPRRPLRFEPAIELSERHGRSLAGMLRWTAHDFDRDGGLFANPLVASQFEGFVMNWLLLAQPSNYSEAIRRRGQPIAPRDVKRVVDYIHDNLELPLRLPDLVSAAGIPGRTLLKHFRDFHGVPPVRYVRNLRMERVRAELEGGQAQGVADVALRWGFAHAGRFAIEYRERFGESPSATLARARRIRG